MFIFFTYPHLFFKTGTCVAQVGLELICSQGWSLTFDPPASASQLFWTVSLVQCCFRVYIKQYHKMLP